MSFVKGDLITAVALNEITKSKGKINLFPGSNFNSGGFGTKTFTSDRYFMPLSGYFSFDANDNYDMYMSSNEQTTITLYRKQPNNTWIIEYSYALMGGGDDNINIKIPITSIGWYYVKVERTIPRDFSQFDEYWWLLSVYLMPYDTAIERGKFLVYRPPNKDNDLASLRGVKLTTDILNSGYIYGLTEEELLNEYLFL